MANKNTNLHNAKSAKKDEFYTQLADVENELKYYKEFFKGKNVLCNCNDDEWSAFFKYFSKNFDNLGLAKLTCVSYNKDGHGIKYAYNGDMVERTELNGHGDFSDDECVALLDECDVVVTNPPFSLFRKFITLLMEHNKKFLVIGSQNAITYKEIFPYIKNNELWLGINMAKVFTQPNGTEKKFGNIEWFTNIDHKKRNEVIYLYKKYNAEEYPKYDNYDAINIDKVSDIPIDYDGVMGVPITFLDKYCNAQFEIVDARTVAQNEKCKNKSTYLIKDADGSINAKPTYARITIKKKPQFEIVQFRKGNDGKDLRIEGNIPYCRILIKKKPQFEIVGMANNVRYIGDYECLTIINGKPIYNRILIKKKPQFEIVGIMTGAKGDNLTNGNDGRSKFYVNGKGVYARFLIKRISE